ncbi:hypothetical protein N9A45_00560 [bacterium]|nr:hypothetical protein [bacterium]
MNVYQQRNIIAVVTVACTIGAAVYLYTNRPVPPPPPVEAKKDFSEEKSKK